MYGRSDSQQFLKDMQLQVVSERLSGSGHDSASERMRLPFDVHDLLHEVAFEYIVLKRSPTAEITNTNLGMFQLA